MEKPWHWINYTQRHLTPFSWTKIGFLMFPHMITSEPIPYSWKVSALDKPKCASQILDRANPQVLKLSKACFYGWGVRERPPLTSVLRREYLLLYHGVAPVCSIRIWQSWVQYTVCPGHWSIRIWMSCNSTKKGIAIAPKRAYSIADAGWGVRISCHTTAA